MKISCCTGFAALLRYCCYFINLDTALDTAPFASAALKKILSPHDVFSILLRPTSDTGRLEEPQVGSQCIFQVTTCW